ncbi:pyridoxal-phosphate dependent enzyme [Pseudodesulfovibrio cashew]|uniref:Pyridoxal-phosphate dependent enzyme n=1 Tax=Pseudodesulfovibrio cashew TaxID=2678688 RepID=A0A6I6JBJ6_9BACT|nr:threonine synthase [Pseudodesulfovibrio cashew]QGY40146.1 pyridoxal-phosphate dependent enzyme [Pseudodesulfovibrio cashew]
MATLVCKACGERFPDTDARWRCGCGGVLDLDFTPSLDPAEVAGRPATLWRYREALPVPEGAELTLGEGFTPLLPVEIGGREVLVKQEHLAPTGSYKDRGAAVMIALAAHLGVSGVVEDSSGNAGCAVGAYCAKAGIPCRIFVPADNSPGKLGQIELYGADLVAVPGSREDTAAACMEAAADTFYASHVYMPHFFHGTKTFAYEVAEQLGWRAPDTVVLPAGNGTLLLGAYIGFTELAGMGLIESVPRLIAVQSAGCAPLAAAFEAGASVPAEIRTSPTLAEGIAIAAPVRGADMLEAVRATDGHFLAVEEDEILAAFRDMGRKGYCIEPTSAAVIAGAARYVRSASPDEVVVTAFTGHGLKAGDKLHKLSGV